jgi:hypothetical protein
MQSSVLVELDCAPTTTPPSQSAKAAVEGRRDGTGHAERMDEVVPGRPPGHRLEPGRRSPTPELYRPSFDVEFLSIARERRDAESERTHAATEQHVAAGRAEVERQAER